MMKILFSILILFSSFLRAADTDAVKPNVAFLTMNDAAHKWVELYVGTRERDELTLLDRWASDALVKERSIFLQASGEEDARFDLRQWVSADILVVVETVEGKDKKKASDLLWFRALDVVTGVRLVDELVAVDLKDPENGLDKVDRLLRENLLLSWQTLWGKERKFAGVSLMDIRLVDAGVEDRQTFSSLYRMLQQMIVQDPSMILLERNLLEKLVEEEAISPSLKLKLRSGMILLSGTVHQETEGAVFTLRGTEVNNKLLFEETFLLDGRIGPEDLAERSAELLAQQFATSGGVHPVDLGQEAQRFHQLATYSFANKRPERALDAAFAAQALAPYEPRYTRSLYKIYYEKVKGDALKLRSPAPEELRGLVGEMHLLFQYQTTIAGYPFENDSAKSLLDVVQSRFGTAIAKDPVAEGQWKDLMVRYYRSLENAFRRENNLSREITEQERDSHIRALVETNRPLIPNHFKLLFGVYPRTGEKLWSKPIAKQTLFQLREIAEQRPYISEYYLRDKKETYDEARDDLYVRNLMLSALNDLAGEDRAAAFHNRQLALLILQNAVLFKRHLFYWVHDTPVEFRNAVGKGFRRVRQEIEAEGWFLPELYYLDDYEMKPEVLQKAFDSDLRLISIARKPGQYLSKRQELSTRLTLWHEPSTSAIPRFELPEEKGGSLPVTEDFGVRQRDWKRHALVWGDRLVSMVGERPRDGYLSDILQVYEKTDAGIVKGKTIRFPKDQVEVRIDKFNDKAFYRALLGGKDHLYYTHKHSLYQFDEEMNTTRVLNLAEWGFPDHMVANLLETPRGVFVVLSKQHLHKEYDGSGRYSGGSYLNNGGVLVLVSEDLELQEILANIERPNPRNELESSGPFGARSFYLDDTGTVQLGAYRHSRGGSTWFEIGEDLVPRAKKYPGNSERMKAWIDSLPEREGWDLDALHAFCKTYGGRFGLKDPYRPGMRLGGSFEFRKVVPLGEGVAVLKDRSDGPSGTLSRGLYYVPNNGRPEDARMLMELKGNEIFVTLFLWGEDLVLTGQDPQHRLIRKETIDTFLGKTHGEAQGPFPSKEHFAAQQAFQKEWFKKVKAYAPSKGGEVDPEPLDHLVKVPGGLFPLHPLKGAPDVEPTVNFASFSMSDTLVTHEEFYRVYKWAIYNGYRFSRSVDFNQALDKLADMPDRPEVDLSPVDAMLYCNARSEWEGRKPAYYLDTGHQKVLRMVKKTADYPKQWTNEHVDWTAGYRLPTEAEWEYVARGCDPNHMSRYPWGDTISHKQASYLATDFYAYDRSTGGLHPGAAGQDPPITPVKMFPPQGYENRFYDLVGNVAEIVWDRREWELPGEETKAPQRPMYYKGGSWASTADECSIQASNSFSLRNAKNHGFRIVLPQ